MGRVFSTRRGDVECIWNFGGKSEGKRLPEDPDVGGRIIL
jgi:hypothetical protein